MVSLFSREYLSIRVCGFNKAIINIVGTVHVSVLSRDSRIRVRASVLVGPEIGVAFRWFRTVELDRLSL